MALNRSIICIVVFFLSQPSCRLYKWTPWFHVAYLQEPMKLMCIKGSTPSLIYICRFLFFFLYYFSIFNLFSCYRWLEFWIIDLAPATHKTGAQTTIKLNWITMTRSQLIFLIQTKFNLPNIKFTLLITMNKKNKKLLH